MDLANSICPFKGCSFMQQTISMLMSLGYSIEAQSKQCTKYVLVMRNDIRVFLHLWAAGIVVLKR